MQSRSARLYRFSLPMDAGVVLRNQFLKSREGFLVQLCDGEKQGWGEISPLPEFSKETLDEALEQARSWLQQWCAAQEPAQLTLPSVAFGLSCAVAELNDELPLEADYRKAPLCNGDPDELFAVLDALEGDKVAKMKVGLYEAVRDGMITQLLLEAIPDLSLRLDANRSWTRAKADGFAKYIDPALRSRIAFLEEPCKTRVESLDFAAQTGIAIAWDESVREDDFVVEAQPGVAAIIIKPTLVGSLEKVKQLIKQAHDCGLQAVISSSVESSFGLTQLARIAKAYTPNSMPGLDTLSLMKAQCVRSWPESDLPLLTESDLDVVWQSEGWQ